MKVERILLYSILIVGLVIISGCKGQLGGFIGGKTNGGGSFVSVDYHTGTKGVEMKFKDKDTMEIDEGDEFIVEVILNNDGATDADGFASIVLYSNEMKVQGEEDKTFQIEGRDQNNPQGGIQELFFGVLNIEKPILDKSKISIQGCYKYKTEGNVELCIDPNEGEHLKVNTGVEKPCTMQKVTSSGQGAPVVVKSIFPKIRQDKLELKIELANLGGGKIREYDQKCGGRSIVNIDRVAFSKYTTDDESIICKTDEDTDGKIIELDNDKDDEDDNVITCKVDLGLEKKGFPTVLLVDLSYGYATIIKKDVKIS